MVKLNKNRIQKVNTLIENSVNNRLKMALNVIMYVKRKAFLQEQKQNLRKETT